MQQTTAGLKFASSLSTVADTSLAVEQIVNEISRTLPGGADLVVAFATPHHAAAFEKLKERLSGALLPSALLAVTAEGVIGVNREVERSPCISVLAASLPGAVIKPFSYDDIDWGAVLKSPDALRETIAPNGVPIKAIILLADPFSTPVNQLLPMIGECFPGVPLVGGMASGAHEPGGNRLLLNGKVMRQGAVGVSIGGDIRVDCTVSQGCRPVGRPLVITKSKRHIVQELGGRNALEVLQEVVGQLGEADRAMIHSNGLLVGRVINEYKERFGRGDFVVRSLVGVDQNEGYIAIGDPQIHPGQTIQFHIRDRKTAREDFELLLEAQKLHGGAAGGLLFSCNGRGTRLFEESDADAGMVQAALGDIPLAGFFAAGELGPIGNQNFIHGHTASLVVFRPGTPGITGQLGTTDG